MAVPDQTFSRPSPLWFAENWNGIVGRKLAANTREDLAAAVTPLFAPFSGFRDKADVDLQVLKSGKLSEKELGDVISLFINFLDRFEGAADAIFAKTSSEPAMIIYRRPIEIWRQILLDIIDGSQNAWTDLAIRPRGDRRDQRRIAQLKDAAAIAYTILRRNNATMAEATESINAVIRSHVKAYKSSLPIFTADALRARARRIAPITVEVGENIVAKAVPNIAELDLRGLKEEDRRFWVLKPIARFILAESLELILLSNRK